MPLMKLRRPIIRMNVSVADLVCFGSEFLWNTLLRSGRQCRPKADASGSNLTFESRLGLPLDLPNMVVGLQADISRFVAEANNDPKPFAWLADPNKSIVAVRRGYQVLDSIH
jgi:hypothetical protein